MVHDVCSGGNSSGSCMNNTNTPAQESCGYCWSSSTSRNTMQRRCNLVNWSGYIVREAAIRHAVSLYSAHLLARGTLETMLFVRTSRGHGGSYRFMLRSQTRRESTFQEVSKATMANSMTNNEH